MPVTVNDAALWRGGRRPGSRLGLVILRIAGAMFVMPSMAGAVFPSPSLASTSNTIVSLTFDDGKVSQYSARSALSSRQMRATFFVNSNAIGASWALSWAQLELLRQDGHEIGGHTLDHVDLTTVGAAEARRQVCDDRTALLAHGFSPVNFAYPFGSVNADVEQIVETCSYESARSVGGLRDSCSTCPFAESLPPLNPYRTRAVSSVLATTPLAALQGRVIDAEQNGGGWVQFTFHSICDACEDHSTSLATLEAFLDWLAPRAASGTVVKTVQDAMASVPAGGEIEKARGKPAIASSS